GWPHDALFVTSIRILQPDFMIRTGLGPQMFGNRVGQVLQLVAQTIVPQRGRAADDVAFHIAAGRLRRKLGIINATNRFPQICLNHAVELDSLARGNANRTVAELIGDIELAEKLGSGDLTARYTVANHKDVMLAESLPAAFLTNVAIVLDV